MRSNEHSELKEKQSFNTLEKDMKETHWLTINKTERMSPKPRLEVSLLVKLQDL